MPLPPPAGKDRPSPVIEGDYASWGHYYNSTYADLNGHQACDCAKNKGGPTIENRFYQLEGVNVIYFLFTNVPDLVRGHWG